MAQLEAASKHNTGEEKAYIATEKVYVNADRTQVVAEDSPEAAHLLATPGSEIPHALAVELGLVKQRTAAQNKKRTPAKNK
jgi:phage tail protein X